MLILFFLLGGLVFLTIGAQAFSASTTALATAGKWHPALRRLILWPLGTRLPLIATAIGACIKGHPLLAFSMVVGSVFFSLLATVGLTALIRRMTFVQRTGEREGWLLVAIGALLSLAFTAQTNLNWVPALGLMLILVATFGYLFSGELPPSHPLPANKLHPAFALALLGVCALFLILGGNLLLEAAFALTSRHGWKEDFTGLTLLAAATALPEFIPAVTAALARQPEPPTATLLRANILSLLGVLGLVLLMSPITIPAHFGKLEPFFLVGAPIALVLSASRKWRLRRAEGFFFLALYALYISALTLWK